MQHSQSPIAADSPGGDATPYTHMSNSNINSAGTTGGPKNANSAPSEIMLDGRRAKTGHRNPPAYICLHWRK